MEPKVVVTIFKLRGSGENVLWQPEQHGSKTGHVKGIWIRLRIDRRRPTRDSKTMGRDSGGTMGKRIRSCLAAALLAGGLPATAAYGQRVSPQEVQRGVTVETRPRRDFDPLGVRLGGFRLEGFAETGLGYDSNVFGRKNDVRSDAYGTESGNVSLESDWTRHAVGASASIDARQYFGHAELNWTDWNLGGFGRYDIDSRTNVEARYRHSREHLDVYNYDVQSAGIFRPVPYDSDEVQVTGTTRFNRFGLTGIGLYRTFRFEDIDVNGVRNFTSRNSFDTMIGAVAGSYAFAPGRFITGIVRLQDISYIDDAPRNPLNLAAVIPRDRDSFSWVALAGFEYDFDGVWAGRIGFGWQQRNYRGAQIKTLEGPAVEGRLSWSPSQLTTVTFNVARTIEESIRENAVSYQRTTGGVRVDHEFLRNVILGAEVRADRREYDQPNGTATDGVAQLNGRWLINRSLSVTGSYAYNRRIEASGGAEKYDRNLVQVRLRIAL
jgi:hypothetical protein